MRISTSSVGLVTECTSAPWAPADIRCEPLSTDDEVDSRRATARYHAGMATTIDRLPFTGDDEADRLLVEEPLALLIGFGA